MKEQRREIINDSMQALHALAKLMPQLNAQVRRWKCWKPSTALWGQISRGSVSNPQTGRAWFVPAT
ncbi:hypothetical protein M8S17_20640 [Enterobacter hormaechei]|nr:hypothetical protein [Enterobacter hormaechei]MCM7444154.1 hypothetical protein [Enterobacter hormaechei]